LNAIRWFMHKIEDRVGLSSFRANLPARSLRRQDFVS
jgi:hypothetical protein